MAGFKWTFPLIIETKICLSCRWWDTAVLQALGRLRQEECQPGLQSETLSQGKKWARSTAHVPWFKPQYFSPPKKKRKKESLLYSFQQCRLHEV
jgi:hypothetical protein